MIKFSISFKPGIPIYKQVLFAVKKAIVSGELKPGDRFPSIRQLSSQLKINPNTAQKILNHLAQAKLLVIRPGIGSVVASGEKPDVDEREEFLVSEIERLVIESKRLSIDKKELFKAIEGQWDEKS